MMYRDLEIKIKKLCMLRSDAKYCISLKGYKVLEDETVAVEVLRSDYKGNYMIYTTEYPLEYIRAL